MSNFGDFDIIEDIDELDDNSLSSRRSRPIPRYMNSQRDPRFEERINARLEDPGRQFPRLVNKQENITPVENPNVSVNDYHKLTCRSIVDHASHCPVCKSYFWSKEKMYILIIVFLIFLIFFMRKR
jgi:uncharacterized protein YlaI